MTAGRSLHLLEVGLVWPPETFLQWRFEGLAARGVRVTVASSAPRSSSAPPVPGVALRRVPPWREPRAVKLLGAVWEGLTLLVRSPRRARRLLSEVRRPAPGRSGPTPWLEAIPLLRSYLRLARLRPDVVHFEWGTAAVHHLPLFDVWRCPVVVSCHGDVNVDALPPGNERWARGLPVAFGRASAVHCVSEGTLAEAAPYGVDAATACLIRSGVDPEFFHPPAPAPAQGSRELRIVSVARLSWVKGFEYALRALRLLVDEGVPAELDIAGEGGDRARLSATIEDLGLGGRVRLRGAMTSPEVRALLHRADVFLQASVSEGTAVSVLEAMACGLPVVATDCGGTREAVTDGREGLLVAPRDPRAMAAALRRLWEQPDLGTALGRAGRARVVSDFALADHVDRFLELYGRLADGPVAPGGR